MADSPSLPTVGRPKPDHNGADAFRESLTDHIFHYDSISDSKFVSQATTSTETKQKVGQVDSTCVEVSHFDL